jgi:hypothetical protein
MTIPVSNPTWYSHLINKGFNKTYCHQQQELVMKIRTHVRAGYGGWESGR